MSEQGAGGRAAAREDPGERSRVRLFLMTAPDRDVGQELAARLVTSGRAACVNLLPGVSSVYRWRGAVESSEEVMMFVKTTADRLSEAMEYAVELHPYDLPEAIVVPVEGGHRPYLDWVVESCRSAEATERDGA